MILIAYASKSGTTEEAAKRLAALLSDVELVDLTKGTVDPGGYEVIVVGSGVRVGSIHKDAKRFIHENAETLSNKKVAFFITNSFKNTSEEIIKSNIPDELRAHAVWAGSVGGRLDIDNLKGIDKSAAKLVKRVVKEDEPLNEDIDDAALAQLAACLT